MTGKWMVVASRTQARLFELRAPGASLDEIEHLENPAGRLHDGDIDADRPGRAFDSVGGGRHAMGREESASEHVAADFAKQIAARLASARKSNAFDDLFLVAEPRFLGRLRGALDDETAARVAGSLDKDLTHCTPGDLASHVDVLLHPGKHRAG